jgi:predicted CDP-diglyceride synthetase/phosphatidate cytidylyltransferase
MRWAFIAIGFILFMLHLVNFLALVEVTGAKNLNANKRIQNHWWSSLTCVFGTCGFMPALLLVVVLCAACLPDVYWFFFAH